MSLKGSTADFPLTVLVRLLGDQKKTGELVLRTGAAEGALGFSDGRVCTAIFGGESPIPALGAIFDLGTADFEFTPWNDPPPANLEGELDELLRKADEHRTWLAGVREVIPHDRIRFRLSERAADQGAVTFTSDRWRVVLAVNGTRDVSDLAAHLSLGRDAALDLLAGLVREGVIETLEPPAEPPPPPPLPERPARQPEPAPAPRAAEPEPPPPPAVVAPPPPAAAAPPPGREWTAPQEWSAPVEPPQAEPTPGEPPPSAAMDDRLAALFSPTPGPLTPPPPEWGAPAASEWTAPEPAPAAPPAADPRLGALTMPPAPHVAEPAPPQPAPANEWAPPPVVEAPQRKGLFGRFRRDETAVPSAPVVDDGAATRAGQLAAFSNALLGEYNSGTYGKARIDDRIGSLLMRVDEQADPIDRPLPVMDDRLDVQALERVHLPDVQAAPYLALLVATIYADAEKAFGRDKAKKGYKAAQQQVFGADVSVLAGPDLAGKLPKI